MTINYDAVPPANAVLDGQGRTLIYCPECGHRCFGVGIRPVPAVESARRTYALHYFTAHPHYHREGFPRPGFTEALGLNFSPSHGADDA